MSKLIPVAVSLVLVAGGLLAWKKVEQSRERLEGPQFTVTETYEDFEVRSYQPQIQAQVTVDGPRDQATTQGFRILANYIFGGNTARTEIAMTAPVSTAQQGAQIAMTATVSTQPAGSQDIAMTAPVSTASAGEDSGYTIRFMMPAKWTMDTLPVPEDPRVQLVEVPAYQAAVRSFSGRVNPKRVDAQGAELRAALQAQGLNPQGEVLVSQFDPPWVPRFMRHNEVELRLQD